MSGRNLHGRDKNYLQKAKRIIKNFNRRVETFNKNNDIKIEKESLKNLEKEYENKKDLTRRLKQLEKFRNDNKQNKIITNKNNLLITQWELNNLKNDLKLYNKKQDERRKIIENIEMTDRGEKISSHPFQMNSEEYNSTKNKSFDFNKFTKKSELDKFFIPIKNRAKESYNEYKYSQLKTNFLNGLLRTGLYNFYEDYEDTIKEIDNFEFYKMYLSEPNLHIEFLYSPEDIETKEEVLNIIFERFWKL